MLKRIRESGVSRIFSGFLLLGMINGAMITALPPSASAERVIYEVDEDGEVTRVVEVEERRGVISTIVEGVGYVIALPFRIIANLFRAIF